VSQWQPIEHCTFASRLGEERRYVLVYGPQVGIQRGYVIDYGDGTQHRAAEGFHGDWKITHWMPLPDPPTPEEPR
jgi:hypothetical protein